jgi:hypothetical protein
MKSKLKHLKNFGNDFGPPRKTFLMNGTFGHDFVVFRPKVKEILIV